MLVIGAALAAAAVGAQTSPESGVGQLAVIPAPAREGIQLTGKERLGEKWQDEQRIDNCKFPLDKRGSRPRPDSCARPPTQ